MQPFFLCEDDTFPIKSFILFASDSPLSGSAAGGFRVRVTVGGAWVSEADRRTDGGLDIEWINKIGRLLVF